MFLFFNRSRNRPISFFERLKSLKNFTPLKEIEFGEIENAVVSMQIASQNIGQIRWHGRYVPAKLLSDVAEHWRDLPTQLAKDVKIIVLGIHTDGTYVVTTSASISMV